MRQGGVGSSLPTARKRRRVPVLTRKGWPGFDVDLGQRDSQGGRPPPTKKGGGASRSQHPPSRSGSPPAAVRSAAAARHPQPPPRITQNRREESALPSPFIEPEVKGIWAHFAHRAAMIASKSQGESRCGVGSGQPSVEVIDVPAASQWQQGAINQPAFDQVAHPLALGRASRAPFHHQRTG